MQKTDNHNLRQKLDLRRMVCAGLNEPLRVLDLFSGEGRLWSAMRETFTIAAYTPVDEKPRQPGCIKMKVDGRTVRAFKPQNFNVIDIDSYGEPWEVFASVLPNIKTPTAVFIRSQTKPQTTENRAVVRRLPKASLRFIFVSVKP